MSGCVNSKYYTAQITPHEVIWALWYYGFMSEHEPMNPLKQVIDLAAEDALNASGLLNQQVYHELKKVAYRLMQKERNNHTLSPTELVHEVYAQLADKTTQYNDSKHFFCAVAKQMRWFLVDYGRHKSTLKSGGGQSPILYTDSLGLTQKEFNFELISQAIDALKLMDERTMEAVELCYFAALTQQQTADMQGISLTTVQRDLKFGRAFISEFIHNASQ